MRYLVKVINASVNGITETRFSEYAFSGELDIDCSDQVRFDHSM